jgi:hypothetical protein
LKYTTASTRTDTLSRVMPSWAGTGMVTICMLTLRNFSTPGVTQVSPGCRGAPLTRPNRKTTPRSNWLTTRMPDSSQSPATATIAISAAMMVTAIANASI